MWAMFLYDKFEECSKDSQVDALVFHDPLSEIYTPCLFKKNVRILIKHL